MQEEWKFRIEAQRRQPVPGGRENTVSNRPSEKANYASCNDDTLWDNLKSAILKTIADVLEYTRKKNRDWFDEND